MRIENSCSTRLRAARPMCTARSKSAHCSLMTRAIHNSQHARLLRWVQPERKSIDVFPTAFKLNSKRDIVKWFGPDVFDDFTYRYEAEPSYFFNNRAVFAFMLLINGLLPRAMKSGLFVFLRRKAKASPSERRA